MLNRPIGQGRYESQPWPPQELPSRGRNYVQSPNADQNGYPGRDPYWPGQPTTSQGYGGIYVAMLMVCYVLVVGVEAFVRRSLYATCDRTDKCDLADYISLGMSAVIAGFFSVLVLTLLIVFRSRMYVGHRVVVHIGAWLGAAVFFLVSVGPAAGILELRWRVQWLVFNGMTDSAVGNGIAYGLLLMAWLAGHRRSLGMVVLAPVGGALCGMVYAYSWMYFDGIDYALSEALEPALCCLVLVVVAWLSWGIERVTTPRVSSAPYRAQ